ncbi:MAG: tagatose-6-phosphate kinase, partial [Candidatus Melainabacteria bacterium]|nr:tagatose-6-phosphate kinase [Candidatus Melainabacteria bacterium]
MIRTKLETTMRSRRCTLLGVGPMSVNCVDATIELANEHRIPLMLIASRRQIDSADFGGGYVNNWTTEEFANYVIENDKRGYVMLARDHGGPWQNTLEKEKKLSLRQAMESAKKSYEADISSGLQIIHIDPSVDIFGGSTTDEILERAYELLDFCTEISHRTNN